MTPNDIEILLHYYTTPGPHPRLSAPAVSEAISEFIAEDILEQYCRGTSREVVTAYRCTNKGRALVKALCEVPYPEVVYLINGRKIKY